MKATLFALFVALLMGGCGGSKYQNPINYFGHNKLYAMQERVNNQLAKHPDILSPGVDLDLTVDINYREFIFEVKQRRDFWEDEDRLLRSILDSAVIRIKHSADSLAWTEGMNGSRWEIPIGRNMEFVS